MRCVEMQDFLRGHGLNKRRLSLYSLGSSHLNSGSRGHLVPSQPCTPTSRSPDLLSEPGCMCRPQMLLLSPAFVSRSVPSPDCFLYLWDTFQ